MFDCFLDKTKLNFDREFNVPGTYIRGMTDDVLVRNRWSGFVYAGTTSQTACSHRQPRNSQFVGEARLTSAIVAGLTEKQAGLAGGGGGRGMCLHM